MDAYSYQKALSEEEIFKIMKREIMDKYPDFDEEFIETIIENAIKIVNPTKFSYSGLCVFGIKDLRKKIIEEIEMRKEIM